MPPTSQYLGVHDFVHGVKVTEAILDDYVSSPILWLHSVFDGSQAYNPRFTGDLTVTGAAVIQGTQFYVGDQLLVVQGAHVGINGPIGTGALSVHGASTLAGQVDITANGLNVSSGNIVASGSITGATVVSTADGSTFKGSTFVAASAVSYAVEITKNTATVAALGVNGGINVVSGGATIAGALAVTGNTALTGNLNISGTITGTIGLPTNLTVTSLTTDDLTVNGASVFRTSVFVVTSGNQVGVHTATPAANFHVNTDSLFSGNITADENIIVSSDLYMTQTTLTGSYPTIKMDTGYVGISSALIVGKHKRASGPSVPLVAGDALLTFQGITDSGGGEVISTQITFDTTTGVNNSGNVPGVIRFYTMTNGAPGVLTEHMTIREDGKVATGVFTATPTRDFEVRGADGILRLTTNNNSTSVYSAAVELGHLTSTGVVQYYAAIKGEMVNNIAGSEDYNVELETIYQGNRLYRVKLYGSGYIYVRNAAVIPGSNPSNGGLLYVESGALKYRGSSGTITTIAAA